MFLSIVIPVYIPPHLEFKVDKFLVPQLESIQRMTHLDDSELIYVVNGSIKRTMDILALYQKHMPITILEFKDALGYTKATNIGMQSSMGEIILLMNDDVILLDYIEKGGWLKMMVNPFFNPKVGLSGMHEEWCKHSQTVFLVGYCLACRRTMLHQIGLLDEIFSPGSGEDTDLYLRAKVHGWEGFNADPNDIFPLYHPGETSFHNWESRDDYKPGSKWDQIFQRNSQILTRRREAGYYDGIQPIPDTVPRLAF